MHMPECEPKKQIECEHRLTVIESKLDTIIEAQRNSRSRAWDVTKMFLSSIAGGAVAVLTTHLWGGKH
jgi:hypothetical protein